MRGISKEWVLGSAFVMLLCISPAFGQQAIEIGPCGDDGDSGCWSAQPIEDTPIGIDANGKKQGRKGGKKVGKKGGKKGDKKNDDVRPADDPEGQDDQDDIDEQESDDIEFEDDLLDDAADSMNFREYWFRACYRLSNANNAKDFAKKFRKAMGIGMEMFGADYRILYSCRDPETNECGYYDATAFADRNGIDQLIVNADEAAALLDGVEPDEFDDENDPELACKPGTLKIKFDNDVHVKCNLNKKRVILKAGKRGGCKYKGRGMKAKIVWKKKNSCKQSND